MTPEQLRRAQEIFDAAVGLEPADRAAFLDGVSGGERELRAVVERLLAAHDSGDRTIADVIANAAREWTSSGDMPREVGPYRLLSELGRGGMGTVWLAERADDAYHAYVAIKLVRGGFADPELARRFRAERQVLADLVHPNIARLLDGGDAPDGTPYLVMEFIDGEPITTYARKHELGVRERLDLFLHVCDAVQHAHASLIVHRDIKPANILVGSDGVPRLVDFGIAKPLTESADETSAIERRLTPSYASPEQIRGERVTTATDVFSLGVLLYELLTGEHPFAGDAQTNAEVQRRVLEDEVRPPSSAVARRDPRAARALAGDIDVIVGRAMHKDPGQRYGSTDQLVADIRRHIAGTPILAVPPSVGYRLRKFVRRNRVAVAAAIVALLGASGFTAFHVARVTRERDVAEAEREKSERVATFMVDLFQWVDPEASRGDEVTARELLHAAAEQLDTALLDEPDVRATLLRNIADVYINIGLVDEARPLIEDVIATLRSAGAPPSLDLTRAYYLRARADGTTDHWRDLLAVADSAGPVALQYSLLAQGAVAGDMAEAGDVDEAIRIMLDVIERSRDHAPIYSDGLSEAEQQMGMLLSERTRWRDAEPFLQSALERRRGELGDDEPRTLRSMYDLAIVLWGLARYDEAAELMRERLVHARRIAGDNLNPVARTLWRLATYTRHLGNLDEAESLALEALEIFRTTAPSRLYQGLTLLELGEVLAEQGRLEEAETALRDALPIIDSVYGTDHQTSARMRGALAALLRDRGQLDESESLLREALAINERDTGSESFPFAGHSVMLARTLLRGDRVAESDSINEAALATLRALLPADHDLIAGALETRAEIELRHNDAAAAEADAREALRIRTVVMPDNRAALARSRNALGAALLASGRAREAEEVLTRAHRDLLDVRGPDHPATVFSARLLADARTASAM